MQVPTSSDQTLNSSFIHCNATNMFAERFLFQIKIAKGFSTYFTSLQIVIDQSDGTIEQKIEFYSAE